jgi:NAD(P)-dependent dehydrogenase (short-subunit alcohol dehydrogenase family)
MSQSSMGQAPLLAGKVALVAGASRGIGAVTARALAEAGAAVVLAARDSAALEAVALEIRESRGRAVAVQADVGEPAEVERLVQTALDNFGRLDIAFNNATDGPPPTPLADIDAEGFDRALRGNARATFLGMKYQIQSMLRTGGGAIVNMASLAGINGVANLAGYVAGKAAVIALTKVAALDYADRGIRVNVVAPGAILTHHLKAAGDEAQRQAAQATPMRRVGQPHEVAAAVVWLCSDQASYITGVVLPIDGGQSAGIKPLQVYRQGKPMPPQTGESHGQVHA